MFWILRDLFGGLVLLALLTATPWAVEEFSRKPESVPPPVVEFPPLEPIYDLAVSRQGDRFATIGFSRQVAVGDISTDDRLWELDFPFHDVLLVQYSPTEPALALGSLEGDVFWQNLAPWEEPRGLTSFSEAPSALAISTNGRWLAAACFPGEAQPSQVRVIEVATGTVCCEFTHSESITWLSFSPDGERLISRDSQGEILVSRAQTGAAMWRLQIPGFRNGPTAASPRGGWLALGNSTGQLALVDLRRQRVVGKWSIVPSMIQSLEYSTRTSLLACATNDSLLLLDTRRRTVVAQQNVEVNSVRFLPDGKLLSAGFDGIVRRWSVPDLTEERRIQNQPL